MEHAQLITPQGERIVLPEYIYVRVIDMLAVDKPAPPIRREDARALDKPPPPMTREEIRAVIAETRGKYAGKPSMTEALLQIRAEERAREREKDAEIAERFFSKRTTRARKARVRTG